MPFIESEQLSATTQLELVDAKSLECSHSNIEDNANLNQEEQSCSIESANVQPIDIDLNTRLISLLESADPSSTEEIDQGDANVINRRAGCRAPKKFLLNRALMSSTESNFRISSRLCKRKDCETETMLQPYSPGRAKHGIGSANENQKSKTKKKFSEKLFDVLSHEDGSKGIAWLPDGKSFVIVDRDYFVSEILPRYFKEAKFESFLRKLKRWGFKRVSRSADGNVAFHHEHFVRDNQDMCKRMRSNSVTTFSKKLVNVERFKFNEKVESSRELITSAVERKNASSAFADDASSCKAGALLAEGNEESLIDNIVLKYAKSEMRYFSVFRMIKDQSQTRLSQSQLSSSHASCITRSFLQQHGLINKHSLNQMESPLLKMWGQNYPLMPLGIGKSQNVAKQEYLRSHLGMPKPFCHQNMSPAR